MWVDRLRGKLNGASQVVGREDRTSGGPLELPRYRREGGQTVKAEIASQL